MSMHTHSLPQETSTNPSLSLFLLLSCFIPCLCLLSSHFTRICFGFYAASYFDLLLHLLLLHITNKTKLRLSSLPSSPARLGAKPLLPFIPPSLTHKNKIATFLFSFSLQKTERATLSLTRSFPSFLPRFFPPCLPSLPLHHLLLLLLRSTTAALVVALLATALFLRWLRRNGGQHKGGGRVVAAGSGAAGERERRAAAAAAAAALTAAAVGVGDGTGEEEGMARAEGGGGIELSVLSSTSPLPASGTTTNRLPLNRGDHASTQSSTVHRLKNQVWILRVTDNTS